MLVLGISAYYHDSAAALVRDGVIVAAAQEERFTRRKFDETFPQHSIGYCLDAAGATLDDVDAVAFYDKPLLTFDRLLETYLAHAPRGYTSFARAMPVWLKQKLLLRGGIIDSLNAMERGKVPPDKLRFGYHHHSHAASAFLPSPFESAAVLVLDGVGEWATTTIAHGREGRVDMLQEIRFPHSIGLLYAAFTYYLGFKINSGEYKVMGLAPYGEPRFADLIFDKLLDLKEDGSFRLDQRYFDYATGLTMTNKRFDALFGRPRRDPAAPLTQEDMDLAASVQRVTEEVVMRLCKTAKKLTGEKNLCLAGGVALNCVANGKVHHAGIFDEIWIQPAAGDAGGALGVALTVGQLGGDARPPMEEGALDRMQGAYLGPGFSAAEIKQALDARGAVYEELDQDGMLAAVVEALDQDQVVGWFQGRMEFGPRALCHRSIIGDARSPRMQRVLNLKIKYRESFRPFAPVVLRDRVQDYFDWEVDSPYMLQVSGVKKERLKELSAEEKKATGMERLRQIRSEIPAVTHVDNSARIQTIHAETNPLFHELLTRWDARTGCPVLVNTSFNIRDEPIVCTPDDAYRCFMGTEMDLLVLGNTVLRKVAQ